MSQTSAAKPISPERLKETLTEGGLLQGAVILGSGLGSFAESMDLEMSIPYEHIQGFSKPGVEGHAGKLYVGKTKGRRILAFSGRYHRYEGYSWEKILALVDLVYRLNVKNLIITNAAGGINPSFEVGDLMLINDYLSMLSIPSQRETLFDKPRSFSSLDTSINTTASKMDLNLKSGTYLYVSGPCYETKAEIQAYRHMGADAVGMSTVPEIIFARAKSIRCSAISLITNLATGIGIGKLSHDEVKEVADQSRDRFEELVSNCLFHLP